jgi:hypothetical protein
MDIGVQLYLIIGMESHSCDNSVQLTAERLNGHVFFFHINVLATVIYKRYILPSMNVITIGTLRGQGS